MDTKIIIAVVVVLIILIVGGGVFYYVMTQSDKPEGDIPPPDDAGSSPPNLPRIVRVEKDDGNLYIRELEIYVDGQNIAPGSIARISKAKGQWGANKINDEVIPSGNEWWHKDWNFAQAKSGNPRFVELELPAATPIDKIVVYNRYDSNREAIIGARVKILNSNRSKLWEKTFEEEFGKKEFTFGSW